MDKSISPQTTFSPPISQTAIVSARDENEVVSCRLADEAVLLQLSNGTYYTLDEVGVVVWEIISSPSSFQDIHHELLKLYDVDAERLETDLLALLNAMNAAELITIESLGAAI